MTRKFKSIAAIFVYCAVIFFYMLLIDMGAAVKISAENFLPAIAGILFAVAGILEEIEELRK